MLAVEAVVSVANLVWSGALARRSLGRVDMRGLGSTRDLRQQVVRGAAILSLVELLALVVERRSEVFFLERYSTDAEIALYSIVFSVVTALVQVPTAMASAVSPAVATLFGAGAVERIRSGYERALRLLVLATLPLTAAGLSVGPALLRAVYGDEYRGTGPVLVIVMLIFPLIAVGGLAGALLTGIGRLRLLLGASAAAAATDIVLSLVLVPRYDAVGAALANAGAQIALAALLLGSVYWLAGSVRLEAGAMARATLAALATGAVGWGAVRLLGDVPGVVAGAVLGTGVFLGLAAGLRIVPARDAAWLDETLGGHFRGRFGRFVRLCARGPA
jgi:O-antigen/teichoic acid export membrane protein